MIKNTLNLNLVGYIHSNIIPLYTKFDSGHNVDHVGKVIKQGLLYAEETKELIDINMLYTSLACHDIGFSISKEKKFHEMNSGKVVREDIFLKKLFTKMELEEIIYAVEDHRASDPKPCRNIYGQLTSIADRCLDINDVVYRIIEHYVQSDKQYNKKEIIEKAYDHMVEKYGLNGYVYTNCKLMLPSFKKQAKICKTFVMNKKKYLKKAEELFPNLFNKSLLIHE